MGVSFLARRVAAAAWIVLLAVPAVAQSPTRMRLVTASPSPVGSPVFMSADVDTLSAGAPTGMISFADGASSFGSVPVSIAGAGQATITVGSGHTCAVTGSGGVKCWGANTRGQLGDGTNIDRATPVWVSGLTSGVVAISAGIYHSCALTRFGGVKCWGYNEYGQLGDGTNIDRRVPVSVAGLASGVVAIQVGSLHSCALLSDGGVKCWGANSLYQLGNGVTSASWTPTPVGGPATIYKALAAHASRTCAVTEGGAVKCWGRDLSRLPASAPGFSSGVVAVSLGDSHYCAITVARSLKCWGHSSYGEIGDGSYNESRHRPVQVLGLASGVTAVDAGARHTCAIVASGAVFCWGDNNFFQTGRPAGSDVLVPGLAHGGVAVALSAGDGTTCVVLADRRVQCWGLNHRGQVGDGNVSEYGAGFASGVSAVLRGQAQSASPLVAGWHLLRASYSGDQGHAGSTSPIVPHRVQ